MTLLVTRNAKKRFFVILKTSRGDSERQPEGFDGRKAPRGNRDGFDERKAIITPFVITSKI